MDEKLKPCPNPWCVSTTAPLPVKSTYADDAWRVKCACGVITHRQDTQDEAIAAWNTRTPSRNDVLEEAARIAEGEKWPDRHVDAAFADGDTSPAYHNQACDDAASAIRARKDQTKQGMFDGFAMLRDKFGKDQTDA